MDNHDEKPVSSRAQIRERNRKQYPDAFEHLIDDILPCREVHLVAGGSGAGKTTWLLEMLDNWKKGRPIFSHKSHPAKFRYFSFDRSKAETIRTATRLGLDPDLFLSEAVIKANQELCFVLEQACKKDPELRLIVVEGIQGFVTDKNGANAINNYKAVMRFLLDLRAVCEKYNVTILGVCHTAKAKKDDHYVMAREKVQGANAWGAFSSTLFLVEFANLEDPTSTARKISIMPRNGANKVLELDMADGTFVEAPPKLSHWQMALMWYAKLMPGSFFTTGEAMQDTGISARKSWDNQRQKMEDRGMIEATEEKGSYRVLDLSLEQRRQILGEFDIRKAAAA